MKGKNISILINKLVAVIIASIVMCITGCSVPANRTIEREFLYSRYRDGVVSKQERAVYTWRGDTIIQELTILDSVKNVLNREHRVFLKTEKGLELLVNGEQVSFLTFDSNRCSRSEHPMGFTIERCFKGRQNYKGYRNAIKFTEENLITDGGKELIYLDDNYAVIDKVRIGLGSYDSVLRIKR